MTPQDDTSPSHPVDDQTPALVVGIGASAGGIRALAQFLEQIPADAPFAYVVILHLSPDHESMLAAVLQRSTSLPVAQVNDTVALLPKHVYVIPPSRSLRAVGGMLTLADDLLSAERRAPIDIFLRTLADVYQAHAVAVILSGTGSDGSMGLKRVKERGGLTMAQIPEEAEHGEMPARAIETTLVDYVLPASQMPGRILDYYRHQSSTPILRAADPTDPSEEDAIREILRLLRTRTAHDFSDYKPATVRRRIGRRMSLHNIERPADYARFLKGHPTEPASLMQELLISVTNFFRDAPAFLTLEQQVIPRLFEGRDASDPVRVWSAGCATGEEAYSVAMLLAEHVGGMLAGVRFQVFATDLDEAAVRFARDGLYSEADVVDVAQQRLQRFFLRETAGFRIRRELREMVVFAHHNVIKDPPFSHLDLVICRNMLIYLNRASQQRVMKAFQFALRGGGYLFLGGAETTDEGLDLFDVVDKAAHIYQVRSTGTRPHLETLEPRTKPIPTTSSDVRVPEHVSAADLHLRLLEQFAPPSIVVSDDHLIVHVSDSAGEFLRTPAGEPTRDVLKLIRPELRADLRSALLIASQQRGPVHIRGARLPREGSDTQIAILVKPVLATVPTLRGYFLIMFEEEPGAPPAPALELPTRKEGASEQLQAELERVNEQLRQTVERSATQVEESKAANEELQAMNEELRSTTEELETGKEELQSSNEELATVNDELKVKIEELAEANNDFQNLITSTELGAIFLDRTMRVKLSSPRAQEVFNLQSGDLGRKLSDITNRLLYDSLYEDIEAVLRHLQMVERQVQTRQGEWYLVRIHPYRTSDDRIEGVAITFLDVSARAQAEERARLGEERFRLLIDSAVDYAIFTMDRHGSVDFWNTGAERLFRYTAQEIIGTDAAVLFTPEDRAAGVPQQQLARAAETGRVDTERWHVRKNGERFYCAGVTMRIGDGMEHGFAQIARDLTTPRRAAMELEGAHAQLEARVAERTSELQSEVTRRTEAQDHVMSLLRQLVTAQEDERARIARDLHDGLGQQLTALRLALERHKENLPPGGQPDAHLERALSLTAQVDREVDFLAWDIRPAALDDLGIVAALPRFLEEWSAHHGLPTNFQTTGAVAGRLSPDAQITFYRVTQEALNNVIKHAHASRVDIVLEGSTDTVVLVIEDDGVGFDSAADAGRMGIGLVNMRERAALIGGTLQVESSPGHGTTVYVRYPVAQAGAST